MRVPWRRELVCASCATSAPPDARFCGRCGDLLAVSPPADVQDRGGDAGAGAGPSTSMGGGLRRAGTLAAVLAIVAVGTVWGTGDLVGPRAGSVTVPAEAGADRTLVAPPSGPAGVAGASAGRAAVAPAGIRCIEDDRPRDPLDACTDWTLAADAPDGFLGYAVDRDLVVTAEPHVVRALDLADGRERWRWAVGAPLCGGPVVVGETVVVADAHGRINGRSRGSGGTGSAVGWSRFLGEGCSAVHGVEGGVVALRGGHLVGLDAASGAVLWERHLDHALDPVAPPVVADDQLIVAQQDRVTSFSVPGGEPTWSLPLSRPAALAVQGRSVAVTTVRGVVLLDAVDGSVRWELDEPGADDVTIVGRQVAVAVGIHVLMVDLHDGRALSRIPVAGLAVGLLPGSHHRELYAVTLQGVQRLDPELVGDSWAVSVPRVVTSAQAARGEAGRLALLADGGGRLAVFTPPDQQPAVVDEPLCGLVQRSEALGGFDAFRDGQVHASMMLGVGGTGELWLGTTGSHVPDQLTIRAVHRRLAIPATFPGASTDEPTSLRVTGGARAATGFPPHWAFAVSLPEPGCWDLEVVGSGLHARIAIPVTRPSLRGSGELTR